MTQHHGFTCYGMGGQYAIFLPESDLIVITTADTQEQKGSNQFLFQSLYETILPALSDEPLPENRHAQTLLLNQTSNLSLPIVKGNASSPIAASISGRVFSVTNAVFDQCQIIFCLDHTGTLRLHIREDWQTISFGIGKLATTQFPIYHQHCAVSGAWTSDSSFYIKCQLLDECISSVHFYFSFSDQQFSLMMKKTVEDSFVEFQGFFIGIDSSTF